MEIWTSLRDSLTSPNDPLLSVLPSNRTSNFSSVGESKFVPEDRVPPRAPEKILILKPSSLGDVVQALPVLRLLKLRFPQARMAWWLESSLVPLLEGDPDLDQVIPFERRALAKWSGLKKLACSVQAMRSERFDWILDLQSLARSAAVSWLANGAFTVGLEDRREGAAALHDVSIPRRSPATHAVDWYLDVLRFLQVPVHDDFVWLPERPEIARQVALKWPVHGRDWVCLQPGARWLNKRWPLESFEMLIRELQRKRPDVGFAILGSKEDMDLGSQLAARFDSSSVLDLTGRTSLLEMVEWLRICRVMVTNDTGPMHVAAALGKPVVGLFGPTDPRRTGPYRQLSRSLQLRLPCAPCLKSRCHHSVPLECLRGLTPSGTVERVMEVL